MANSPPPPSTPPPPTAPPPQGPPPSPNVPPSGQAKAARVPKKFAVAPLQGANDGEKIMVYGKSGMGKTTIAGQIENAVFIPIDDGARKLVNPITGQPLLAVQGVETFDDLRDVVRQAAELVPAGGALVIDTITKAQALAEAWVVENVPLDGGGKARDLNHYGWAEGWRHTLDAMRCLLSDLDSVIRTGRHVVLLGQLAQDIVANAGGTDYYEDVPKLNENKKGPIRTEVCEWCDHVFRLGLLDANVSKDHVKSAVGKISGTGARAVFTGGQPHFTAKTRNATLSQYPVVGFENPQDNSLWQFLLHGATAA